MTDLASKLAHLVTAFDRKQEAVAAKRGRPHNIYALAIMLRAVDRAVADVGAGASVARALYDNFNDRLLTHLEKGCGVAVTFGGGAQDKGRPA